MTEKKHTEVLAGEGYVSRGTDPLAAVRYRLRVIDTLQDQQGGWNPIHTEAIRTSRRIEGGGVVVSGDKTWIAQEQPICLYLADGSGRTSIFVPSGYTITGSFDVDNNLGEFESD